jgi:hypothetical protein
MTGIDGSGEYFEPFAAVHDARLATTDDGTVTADVDFYRRSRPSASGLDPEAVHGGFDRGSLESAAKEMVWIVEA